MRKFRLLKISNTIINPEKYTELLTLTYLQKETSKADNIASASTGEVPSSVVHYSQYKRLLISFYSGILTS